MSWEGMTNMWGKNEDGCRGEKKERKTESEVDGRCKFGLEGECYVMQWGRVEGGVKFSEKLITKVLLALRGVVCFCLPLERWWAAWWGRPMGPTSQTLTASCWLLCLPMSSCSFPCRRGHAANGWQSHSSIAPSRHITIQTRIVHK